MSIREAAEAFGIPQLTLDDDKLHGKSVSTITVSRKDPMLSKTVEDW